MHETQNVVLLGSVGDSPSFEGRGASWAPGDTNIVGSVFLLFIFPFIFLSMVAWGGVHKHTLIKYATNTNKKDALVKIGTHIYKQ